MNEFERKLSQQPFRAPPAGLREAILSTPSNVVIVSSWTWRDWLWPSPRAWGALAAVWAIFATVSFFQGDAAPPAPVVAVQPAVSVTLLSFHQTRHRDHVLELSN